MKQNNNLPFIIGISIAFGIIVGSYFNVKNAGDIYPTSQGQENNKLNTVLRFVESQYVDDVDVEKVTDAAIETILDQLDPHSSYTPKELQAYTQETMNGNFVGIGVQFAMKKDTVVVIKVIPDGPSKKAGLRDGDRLLMANKDTLYGKEFKADDIVKRLKGKENTQVLVKVFRQGSPNLIDFNITRGKVAIKSVPVAYQLNDSLGYIKLVRFAATSYDEFKTALDDLKEKGVQDLVLDLRGNPGGYMHIADQIADEFLADGKLIVYTKNKKGRQKNSVATSKGAFEKGHIYVLVDEYSASASEIVSGALQDHDRATIIGRRTFGKGLVQQELGFNDGSAMRLTIARYYTPTGRSIQKPYGAEDNYNDEVESRYKNGELFHKDSIKIIDSLKFKTPKGKLVYGGGGITPDVFIPLDTINGVNYFELNLVNNFIYNYVDKHRDELAKFNQDNFESDFVIDDKIKKEFAKFIKSYQFKNKQAVLDLLKENFASTLTTDEVYYKEVQKRDPYILEVELLQQNQ